MTIELTDREAEIIESDVLAGMGRTSNKYERDQRRSILDKIADERRAESAAR